MYKVISFLLILSCIYTLTSCVEDKDNAPRSCPIDDYACKSGL